MANEIPSDDEILSQHRAGETPAPTPAPVAEPGPAAPAPGAPAAPSFNPADWSYKFRDSMVTPKDRGEMIELMQFGRSFRENRPKWEKDQQALRDFEAKKDTYSKYDQLSQALQANPEFRTELEQLAQKYSGQPKPQQQDPAGIPPEVAQKLAALEEWKNAEDARKADDELQRELDDVQKSEASYDWKTDRGEGNLRQRLLKYMSEKQVYNAQTAFDAMIRKEDVQRAQMETRRKAEEDAAKARKAGVVPAGTQPAPAPTPAQLNHKAMSYDALENAALESLSRR